MATGTVKWFDDAKGYGFIAPEDGGKDLFVHHSGIGGEGFKSLSEGAKVEFEAREGQKGPRPSTSSPSRRRRRHQSPWRNARERTATGISFVWDVF